MTTTAGTNLQISHQLSSEKALVGTAASVNCGIGSMSPIKNVIFKLEPAISAVPIDGNIMHDKGEKCDNNHQVESPRNRASAP